MKRAATVRVLVLDNNKLTNKYMPELSQAIWCNNTLEYLSMQGCSLYDYGCVAVMDGLIRNHSLIELNLSNNNLRAPCAKRIAEVLSAKDMKLRSLILSQNCLGD